jgi:protein involved in polysaccharide export with SLBB domain
MFIRSGHYGKPNRLRLISGLRKTSLILCALVFLFTETIAQQTTGPANNTTNKSDTLKTPGLQNNQAVNNTNTGKEPVGGLENVIAAQKMAKTKDSIQLIESKIFGYAVFHNTNISFTPNLNMATPKSYVVGPGDELQLQVYGIAQNKYTLRVTPEGNVTIPDIGMAKVAGFSIEAVKSILINKLSIRYSGISGTSPNTFLDVTLGNIRTIKVNMVGEVARPGTYSLPSYTNIFNALFSAGGPTIKGTFRYVQVYRAGKLKAEIDIYDFLVNGKTNNNVRLEDDDVVLVRPATNRIEIEGEVRIPGIFEFKANETFKDILNFAGGFSDNAYKELVSLTRKGLIEKQVLDLPSNRFGTSNLNDGDLFKVGVLLDRYTNRVQVSGSINRPGAYSLDVGMSVADLIQKAGGLKGDAFIKRALIYRTKQDFTQEVINVDLSNVNGPGGAATIKLQREDVLSIANIYDIQEEYFVQITGEVNSNGVYPYADSLTVGDLILKAGGFKYSATGSFIEIIRRAAEPGKIAEIITVSINKDLSITPENSKLLLKPFDQIYVRATPGFEIPKLVSIDGEVALKGTFAIDKKEMRISDLLRRAGGLTPYAYPRGATLVRRTKKFIAQSSSELDNQNLNALKSNLTKDPIVSSSESNKELNKRIDAKIALNTAAVAKDEETKNKELLKQSLVKENVSTVNTSSASSADDKTQELVAIDMEAILKNPGTSIDLVLKDGDILNIPEKLETVSIKGGVLYPVSVRYEPGLSFREYINRSGGYSNRAIKNKAYVLQANGRVERVKSFWFFRSYPKIEPGAEVFVPATLQDKPPFNYANTVGVVTGLITSTLTLIFLLRTL